MLSGKPMSQSSSMNPKKHGRSPRSDKHPEFTHHQHIGRVSSNTGLGIEPEVESAYQQWANRKRLEAYEQALHSYSVNSFKVWKAQPRGYAKWNGIGHNKKEHSQPHPAWAWSHRPLYW